MLGAMPSRSSRSHAALALAFASALASALVLAALAGGCQPGGGTAGKVEVIAAPPDGEVAPWVAERVHAAHARGRDVLVYVGASWCEPCQHFHHAVDDGRLDVLFGTLTLLEFHQDRDDDRLTRAGYVSRMIPLFAQPGPDGTASGRQIEGSIHGEGAVVELTPRLHALLRGRRPARAGQ
jgi:hypothetical protein